MRGISPFSSILVYLQSYIQVAIYTSVRGSIPMRPAVCTDVHYSVLRESRGSEDEFILEPTRWKVGNSAVKGA